MPFVDLFLLLFRKKVDSQLKLFIYILLNWVDLQRRFSQITVTYHRKTTALGIKAFCLLFLYSSAIHHAQFFFRTKY